MPLLEEMKKKLWRYVANAFEKDEISREEFYAIFEEYSEKILGREKEIKNDLWCIIRDTINEIAKAKGIEDINNIIN